MSGRLTASILLCIVASSAECRAKVPRLEPSPETARALSEPALGPVAASAASVAAPPFDPSPCPPAMAWIEPGFCVDRWEASLIDDEGRAHSPFHPVGARALRAASRPGVIPQAHISAEQAERACERSGKALCTTRQWVDACRGSRHPLRQWPYGAGYDRGACNDVSAMHPVDRLAPGTGRKRDVVTLNDPRINQQPDTVAPTGSFGRCATPEQVFDLVGNLLEWTRDPRPLLMGGHYVDARENGEGCTYVTMVHGPQYHDFTTGFRCCQVPGMAAPTRGGTGAWSRSFDDPRAPLPPAPIPAKYGSADAPCSLDMVLVE
ncbi:MAG TPA: SUMF1/EgtB/PvdO family nonheme iron enzyme, partial [Polyangiaceae bacterium]|nr:SUMF1/EgtB/PvdO family nonheme iron enzyme [Polyangiaceae bacterium]